MFADKMLDVVFYSFTQIFSFEFFKFFSEATRTSSQVTFPVDFFEHNQQLTEVEFGGNDLLQVYNGQQIKHRLNSTGMYVANTKVETFKHITLLEEAQNITLHSLL